jgi:hypothetical protein
MSESAIEARTKEAYCAECEAIRDMLKAIGCILIVIEGERGTDISVRVPDDMRAFLPDLLRRLARREELRREKESGRALLCPVCALSRFIREQNDGAKPVPGDNVVCANARCASFLRVDSSGHMRLLELQDVGEWPDDTRIQMCAIREAVTSGQ